MNFFKRLTAKKESLLVICKNCDHMMGCHGSRGETLQNGLPARNGCNADVVSIIELNGLKRFREVECRCDLSRAEVVLNHVHDQAEIIKAGLLAEEAAAAPPSIE